LPPPGDSDEEPLEISAVGTLVRTPEIAATILALVFHTGLEGAMFIWLPTFGLQAAGFPQGTANLLLSAYTIAYIPGRLFYTFVSERFGYGRLILLIEVLIVPVFVWTFFFADGVVAVFAGAAMLGVLISGIFPTITAFGTEAAPEYSAPINALATGTASISIAAVPLAMGVATDLYSIRTAMWIPLVLTAAVAPIVFGAMRLRDDPTLA
jgi:fucose permease